MTTETRDIYTCGGCGTHDKNLVECGGIYHCPNKFCLICGAFTLRVQAGYQDAEGNQTDEQFRKMASECEAEIRATEKRLEILRGCLERLNKKWAT